MRPDTSPAFSPRSPDVSPVRMPNVWPNTHVYYQGDGGKVARLYETNIVVMPNVHPRKVVLSCGGWNTPITRKRINQVLAAWSIPFKVCANDFKVSSQRVLTYIRGYWDWTA